MYRRIAIITGLVVSIIIIIIILILMKLSTQQFFRLIHIKLWQPSFLRSSFVLLVLELFILDHIFGLHWWNFLG
jgi:hypothetical protein